MLANGTETKMYATDSVAERVGQVAVIGLAFAIPISTAMTNVFMLFIVFAWLWGGHLSEKWSYIKQNPVVPYTSALFALFIIAAFYSVAEPYDIRHGLSDQAKLMYLPILIWFLRKDKIAKHVIDAIVLAMLLTCILGLFKFYFDLPIGLKYSEAAVFKNHIKTNFFMAFAAFLIAHRAVAIPSLRKWALPAIALMLYYAYFMSMGRTGYVLMFALLMLFAWQHFRWRGILLGTCFFILLFGACYSFSETFYSRVAHVSCELIDNPEQVAGCENSEAVLSDTPTSIEYRLQFLKTTWHVIQPAFWFGHGTGSFRQAYLSGAQALGTAHTDNPHNEYVHIWVELGLVGLLVFLAFFVGQWRALSKLTGSQRHLAEGVLWGFMIGCLANSWLMDFSEIHFWMLLLAVASRRSESA